MQVRQATCDDLAAIGQIYCASLENNTGSQETFWQSLIASGGLLVAAEGVADSGAVVGFGTIDVTAGEQIKQLYVLPDYQGRGVGSMILAALEEVARSGGLKELVLHAAPGAVAFYERAGYNPIPADAVHAHDHDGVMMEKKLTGEK